MNRRTNETPMDFQWEGTGPGDATSPFFQLSMQHKQQQQQRKRPHSVFESSRKPSTPALREPKSQPFLFSQSSATTQPSNPAFTTPRKVDLDFSSGAENLSSPDNADNEDTPEQPEKSDRRNSLFGLYGRFAPSPGRGEIPRTNKFSNVLVRRVHKRRRRDKGIEKQLLRLHDGGDDSDRPSSSEGSPRKRREKNAEPHQTKDIPYLSRFFTFLESHPHIPRILSYYAQFTFNLILAFLTLYVVVAFLLAIKYDVERAGEEVSADILAEMAVCSKNYIENRCGGQDGRRLPALEAICENWERCMNRDPSKVGRAKVSAQTLAEIFNGFIEPISFKTMVFFIVSITSFVAVSNLTFSFFRNRSNNPPIPHMHSYMPYPPPHMPQQHSQIGFTPGPHGSGTGEEYFGHPSGLNFNYQNENLSPRKVNRDQGDEGHKRLDFGPASHYEPRTPSPVKRDRKMFA
ncbi:hypothetical protein AJ80_03693 [Polytolypa hystricis UAMH7299]|uniref:Brl1/Brr6 domain-containing protein n=1 Tax=Polytolypa hystricis (strain UAMH7299) TaxID=1447883 RepID=A0A2B7YG82_POLH7|nr:hypothetical protein AJ80_03693 [Polytolypa hystricis UAMH7299]